MEATPVSLAESRRLIEAARVALEGLPAAFFQATGAELTDLLGEVDAVVAAGVAARAEVVVEAARRGEVAASSKASATTWIADHAPSLRQGGAGTLAAWARRVTGSRSGLGAVGQPDPETPLGEVYAAVRSGQCSVELGLAVLGEMERLEPLLVPAAVSTVTGTLLDLGMRWGIGHMRRLRPAMIARYGLEGEFDKMQEKLARSAFLSAPLVCSGDVTQYRMALTPEQAATLEAAIGPLSRPRPDPETGALDRRPTGQRRAEALIEVVRIGAVEAASRVSVAASGAVLHVTLTLEDLLARLGAGEVIGSSATGALLAPGVVRALACDADVVPHVLGADGAVLDVGRAERRFTSAQRHALWLRDRHCTYPGCEVPATWCRAHHIVHWADGGQSDLANGALLCQRHHSLVHSRDLVAVVNRAPDDAGRYVVWDLRPGGYATVLEVEHGGYCMGRQCRHTPHAPPTLTPQELLAALAQYVADKAASPNGGHSNAAPDEAA